MFKNVASQKVIVFAFDYTTNAPKTGDAANLTAYVSKDWGTVTVLGDTSATEMDATNAKGYYLFDLTQAETNADTLLFSAKSSTSNVSVIGVPATVYTVPPLFTSLSVDSNGRVDVIKIAGTTQTARDLGTSVLLSSGTGTGQVKLASGYIAPNWGDVGNPTTSLALTGTTIAVTQKVDVETIKTNPVVNGGTITFPTTATLASTTNITAGVITTVTNLTNAPTAGDLTATMKTSVTTAATAATPIAASVTGAVGSVVGNVGGNVTGSVGSVVGAVGSVTGAVASVTGNVGGNVVGTVASVVGAVGSVTGLTASNLDATVSSRLASASYTTPPTANQNADALLDRANGVETGYTPRQSLRLMLSSAAAKLSGAATTTVAIRDVTDTKDRITATVDASGNRTAVTYDVS